MSANPVPRQTVQSSALVREIAGLPHAQHLGDANWRRAVESLGGRGMQDAVRAIRDCRVISASDLARAWSTPAGRRQVVQEKLMVRTPPVVAADPWVEIMRRALVRHDVMVPQGTLARIREARAKPHASHAWLQPDFDSRAQFGTAFVSWGRRPAVVAFVAEDAEATDGGAMDGEAPLDVRSALHYGALALLTDRIVEMPPRLIECRLRYPGMDAMRPLMANEGVAAAVQTAVLESLADRPGLMAVRSVAFDAALMDQMIDEGTRLWRHHVMMGEIPAKPSASGSAESDVSLTDERVADAARLAGDYAVLAALSAKAAAEALGVFERLQALSAVLPAHCEVPLFTRERCEVIDTRAVLAELDARGIAYAECANPEVDVARMREALETLGVSPSTYEVAGSLDVQRIRSVLGEDAAVRSEMQLRENKDASPEIWQRAHGVAEAVLAEVIGGALDRHLDVVSAADAASTAASAA